MKRIRVFALLAAIVLIFTGCSAGKRLQPADLLGVWVLTDMTGSEEATVSMQYYETMGWKVSMAISNDTLEMTTFDGTHSDYQATAYRIEGTKLITDASEMECVLDGDTLSLTTGGVTMVFTRK